MKRTSLKNKTILITGGTGSFGRTLAYRLLKEDTCGKVIIFSRDEWKQWEMRRSDPLFDHPKIRYFIGDVRDAKRLARAFNEVDVVIHAAALKQVPAAEYNPSEFVNTNVLGAMNIIDAAIDCGVGKVLALSTDKAVNPINLYGATKLCADKLFVAGNSYVGARGYPTFSVVRYGNVLGTRGSILPMWRQMLDKGARAVPVTHPEMTRFWITLEQAVDFVLRCYDKAVGGEIFIPKIPSVKIVDLARAVAPGVPQEIIGIRPGEKLHELLLSAEDSHHSFDCGDHYLIAPEIAMQSPGFLKKLFSFERKGTPLEEGFVYSSDSNSQWLREEELQTIVDTVLKRST